MPRTISVALTPGVVAACAGSAVNASADEIPNARAATRGRDVRYRDARFFTAFTLSLLPALFAGNYNQRADALGRHQTDMGWNTENANRR